MDQQSFLALKRECRETLKAYVVEAKITCTLLSRSKGESLSQADIKKLMRQRSYENELHRQYMQVRERLFAVAHLGYRSDLSRHS